MRHKNNKLVTRNIGAFSNWDLSVRFKLKFAIENPIELFRKRHFFCASLREGGAERSRGGGSLRHEKQAPVLMRAIKYSCAGSFHRKRSSLSEGGCGASASIVTHQQIKICWRETTGLPYGVCGKILLVLLLLISSSTS